MSNYMPDFAISSIVDNLILMNFVELGTSLRRAITVAKARGSEHEFVTREYTIGPGGISLLPMEEGKALPVLPFQSYYGLLSRADAAQPRFAARREGRRPFRSNVTLLCLACNTARKPCPSRSIGCWSTTATKTMASPPRSRWASSCRRPSVPTSWTRPSGKTGWQRTPVARTSRWPSPMRPAACSGRPSTPDRRGVSCTPRPRLFRPLRKGRQRGWGVPSPWRRFRPVTALPTPWPEAALSWRATERGWCISPCRWCWADIHWGRWSRAKCLTSTPNNWRWSSGQAARSLTGTGLAGGSPGTSCQAGHPGSICRPAGDPGPDVPPDALHTIREVERLAEMTRLRNSALAEMIKHRRAEEALKEADRRKDEFLAMLAHELRNPLAADPQRRARSCG